MLAELDGTFHRQTRQIVQDIKLYRGPEGLEELLRVLVGIITVLVLV